MSQVIQDYLRILIFSSITQNNTNALEQGQGIFGEHKSFGNIGNTQVNTTNQRQVLHFGTSNTTNTVSNNVSPLEDLTLDLELAYLIIKIIKISQIMIMNSFDD